MTQPHQIDREAVEDLCARLRRLTPTGILPRVLVNPDGPQAALLIERLAAPMEAVAWRYRYPNDLTWQLTLDRKQAHDKTGEAQALYTHPVQGGEG